MSYKDKYLKNILGVLSKNLDKTNVNSIPKITKIVVNVGMGTYVSTGGDYNDVLKWLKVITSQSPLLCSARKSISNFKLREGNPVGACVTLRRNKMYDFLERLITVVFPRIRDFRGFSKKSFDGMGNYTFGISSHLVFPEIPTNDIIKPFGIQITIVTTTDSNDEAYELIKEFGFPFKK